MKISHFLLLALISISLSIGACKDKKDETATEPQTTEGQMTTPAGAVAADPAASSTTGNTTAPNNEPHFKCSKPGCAGTGSAAGKCSICGSDLAHNQAYHAKPGVAPGTSPDNALQVTPSGGDQTKTVPATPVAQNSKGEYHYTCPKGHPGAAQAGNCAKCGEALSHNPAFHNE